MRIESTGSGTISAASPQVTQPKTPQTVTEVGTASGSTKLTEETFTPTSDLQQLLSAVRALPDVRDDVLGEVSGRLEAGELETRTAAQETAAAFLNNP
jgi:hypothetical protein